MIIIVEIYSDLNSIRENKKKEKIPIVASVGLQSMRRCTINGSIIRNFSEKTFSSGGQFEESSPFFFVQYKLLVFLGCRCVFDTLHLLCVANRLNSFGVDVIFSFFFSFIKSYVLLLFSRMFYLTGVTVCSRQLNYFALCTCACIKILLLWHSLCC